MVLLADVSASIPRPIETNADPVSCLGASPAAFRKHASGAAVLSVRSRRPMGASGYPSSTSCARSTAAAR